MLQISPRQIAVFLTVLLAFAAVTPASAHEYVDYFEPGETHLSPRGYGVAREVAAYARQVPSRIVITGHEDGLEAATSADERLDLWRAREMMLELMRLGVSPWTISIQTRGDTHLARVVPAGTAEPLNRRVALDVNRLPPPVPETPGTPRAPGAPPTPPRPVRIVEPYRPLISFAPGSTRVTREDEFRLRLGTFGFMPGGGRIIVRGHTDTVGTSDANLDLSRRRAEAVARALVSQGMLWDDIQIVASGESQLLRPSSDEVAEPANRRVTVDFVFQSPAR